MPRLSIEGRKRIVSLYSCGVSVPSIVQRLKQEKVAVSRGTLKQRAKHPIKIHIWGGISTKGATSLVMFTGIMNAERLGTVCEAGLLKRGSQMGIDCTKTMIQNIRPSILKSF